MHVIVIGAGLGGLALAQALRQHGIEAEVYEQDTGIEARFQGYRIGLSQGGWESLKWCLPPRLHPLLEAISGEMVGPGLLMDEQLRVKADAGAKRPQQAQHQDDERHLSDRHVLRYLLLATLGECVHFGKQLTGFAVLADGAVRVAFADGTTAIGDLLVGADGVGSAVRRQLVGPVEPVETGLRGAIGRTPQVERFTYLV